MPADVVRLSDVRARRAGIAHPGPPPKPTAPAHLYAESGTVVLEFGARGFNPGTERLLLSPEHARVWAERLAAMADTAEATARKGGRWGA